MLATIERFKKIYIISVFDSKERPTSHVSGQNQYISKQTVDEEKENHHQQYKTHSTPKPTTEYLQFNTQVIKVKTLNLIMPSGQLQEISDIYMFESYIQTNTDKHHS